MLSHFPREIQLDYLNTYTYLIFSIISGFASFILFFIIILSKNLRKPPGDLIAGLAVTHFFLCIHWAVAVSRTYYLTNLNSNDDPDGFICISFAFGVTVFSSLECFYTLTILVYIRVQFQNLINKKKAIQNSAFTHLTLWALAFICSLICYK